MTATIAAYAGDDTELVAAVRRGDDRAFETLYQRYHTRIAAYVRGMVRDHARAEDVMQEVFLSALRRMRDTERPIVFKPWIYEIARNACIDSYRRTSRADELSYDADGGLGSGDHLRLVSRDPTPDAAVESKQKLNDLCGAFGGLSETHHQVLVLRELEGLSYREIGERLGMSRPAVESTLFRARRRLTEEYEELISGRRCERVQGIISAAAEGMLGARDRRRLARHTATCQSCRRHARMLGLEDVASATVRGRLAALLPIPAFLRRGADSAGVAGSHGSSLAAQLSSVGAAGDSVAAGLTKALATAAVLGFAGTGAHVAAQHGHPLPGLGGAPVVGAGEDAALRAVHGSTRATTVERLLSRAAASSTTATGKRKATDAKPSTRSRAESGDTTTSATRDGGTSRTGSSDNSSPATAPVPSAPSAPDTNVKLPLGSGSGAPAPSAGNGGGSGSGVSLPDVQSVTSNVGDSAPSAPSTPSVDVRSVVTSVTGSGP